MKKLTQTLKSLVTGAAFAAAAIVSTSANANVSIGDGYVEFVHWSQVQSFCGHSVINCTLIENLNGYYRVWFN